MSVHSFSHPIHSAQSKHERQLESPALHPVDHSGIRAFDSHGIVLPFSVGAMTGATALLGVSADYALDYLQPSNIIQYSPSIMTASIATLVAGKIMQRSRNKEDIKRFEAQTDGNPQHLIVNDTYIVEIFENTESDGQESRHLFIAPIHEVGSIEEMEEVALSCTEEYTGSAVTLYVEPFLSKDDDGYQTLDDFLIESGINKVHQNLFRDEQRIITYAVNDLRSIVEERKVSNFDAMLNRLESVTQDTKLIENLRATNISDSSECRSAFLKIRRILESKCGDVVQQRITDQDGNIVGRSKTYLRAEIDDSGDLVKLVDQKNRVIASENILTQLGIQSEVLDDVFNEDTRYADGKVENALLVLILRELSEKVHDMLERNKSTDDLDSGLKQVSLGHQIAHAVTSRYNLYSKVSKRPKTLSKLGALACGVLFGATLSTMVASAADSRYIDIRESILEEAGGDRGDERTRQEITDEINSDVFIGPYFQAVDNTTYYNDWVLTQLTKLTNNFQADPPTDRTPESRARERALDGALKTAGELSSRIGNINPYGENVSLLSLETFGNVDTSGYWTRGVATRYNQDNHTFSHRAAVYGLEGNYEFTPHLIYSEFSSLDSVPKMPGDDIVDYIKVTPNYAVGMTTAFNLNPSIRYFKTREQRAQENLEEYGVEDTPLSVLYEGDTVEYLDIPIKNGYKLVAAVDPTDPSVSFRVEMLENGQLILIPPQGYTHTPGRLEYFLEKSDDTDSPRAWGTTFTQNTLANTSRSDTILANEALSAWSRHYPEIDQAKSDEEKIALMYERIKSGNYSLSPIPTSMLEDGLTVSEIVEATISEEYHSAVCNTANAVLFFSTQGMDEELQLGVVTGFYNSGYETEDSNPNSISSNEGHMWTVNKEGKILDATPNLLTDQYDEFFSESDDTEQNRPSPVNFRNILLGLMAGTLIVGNRKNIKKAYTRFDKSLQKRILDQYTKTGALAREYSKINHTIFAHPSTTSSWKDHVQANRKNTPVHVMEKSIVELSEHAQAHESVRRLARIIKRARSVK